MIKPKLATSDADILKCFDVMSQLRMNLNCNEFIKIVRLMESEGYHLSYIECKSEVVAVAGYRISTNLAMGKNLYIDDLVASGSKRSKGYGKIMVNWLRNIAINNNCSVYHLGSGTNRSQAHKFYFKEGFSIVAYAFCESLDNSQ